MTLVALRNAVVSTISSAVSDFRSVETGRGRYGLKDIERLTTKAPCCIVADLGGTTDGAYAGVGSDRRTVRKMAAFILTTGKSTERRDVQALTLTQAVLATITNATSWGLDEASAPTNIADDNLFSTELDKRHAALAMITWDQPYSFTDVEGSTLDNLEEVHGDWDTATEDDEHMLSSVTGLYT